MANLKYIILGMHVGTNSYLPNCRVSWPHQVYIGKNCTLEEEIIFKYDGIAKKERSIIIQDKVFIGNHCEFNINGSINIGSYSNIASGCKFIDHDHGTRLGELIGPQPSVINGIILEEDVWLGANVIVLKGVTIGSGAVVAAGAVVTRSIPSNEIWGGVPAKRISKRTTHAD
jgi:acetyltransferase-like isoleucine patch superfamily enzyme